MSLIASLSQLIGVDGQFQEFLIPLGLRENCSRDIITSRRNCCPKPDLEQFSFSRFGNRRPVFSSNSVTVFHKIRKC